MISLKLSKTLKFISLFGLIFAICCTNKTANLNQNNLEKETSLYLQQHANNPVYWQPWSQDVLKIAQQQNKLIVISIGYSSCHWCHVMEEETFEDNEVAKLMNKSYISIKIDREERPDIDELYSSAVQLLTGKSGWPLNVIALPDGKPLYGGTYHTKKQWLEILTKISEQYSENSQEAKKYGNKVASAISDVYTTNNFKKQDVNKIQLSQNIGLWKTQWDTIYGGNLEQEKFIIPTQINYLMDYGYHTNDSLVINHIVNTLDLIAASGIYDHIGGGFFRYTTDAEWKYPHYEKMLYDNAQLIHTFSKAYKMFKKPNYKHIVEETFEFLLREMKSEQGGFYAALDAGKENKNNRYYTWTDSELKNSINAIEYETFSKQFIFNSIANNDDLILLARNLNANESNLSSIKKWKKSLLEARLQRKKPIEDKKIITSWNALLIEGLIVAYEAFGDKRFLDTAIETYDFLVSKCYADEVLMHTYQSGSSKIDGFLDDYANLAAASLRLYNITSEIEVLKFSEKLVAKSLLQFGSDKTPLLKYTSNDNLIADVIKKHDGVMPSGNATMAHSLFTLGHILYKPDYVNKATSMFQSISADAKENPKNFAQWQSLALKITYPFYEMAFVGKDSQELANQFNKRFYPNVLAVYSTYDSELPLFKYRFVDSETYIYVCKDNTCKLPVKTMEEAIRQLQNF